MRYFWLAVVGLTLAVPALLIAYGYEFNKHTTSTVGGPVTLGLCIALAIGFDAVLWVLVVLVLAARSWKSSRSDVPVK